MSIGLPSLRGASIGAPAQQQCERLKTFASQTAAALRHQ